MKNCGLLLLVACTLALAACGGNGGGGAGADNNAQPSAFAGPGKTCGAGYLRARMPWGVKCLVHGESCKAGRKRAYVRWGFRCVNGRLVDV
jgi:hypothetical protein